MFFKRELPRPTPLFFLARKAGLAYLQVPKAACTSLKVAIALLNRPELEGEVAERPMHIHIQPGWNDIVQADDPAISKLFRFTFVRHPVARFLSFYQNKILWPIKGIFSPEFTRLGLKAGMPLTPVLDRLAKVAPRDLDPHIAPQHWLVFNGDASRVDFIGRIESLSEGLAEIEKGTGVKLAVAHHNRSASDETQRFSPVPDELARIVEFYAGDFERFGYSPNEF